MQIRINEEGKRVVLKILRIVGLTSEEEYYDRYPMMYLGKIVELGKTKELIDKPVHPYTKALVNAAPSIVREKRNGKRDGIRLTGEVSNAVNPNAVNPPDGCRLSNRCPFARVLIFLILPIPQSS